MIGLRWSETSPYRVNTIPTVIAPTRIPSETSLEPSPVPSPATAPSSRAMAATGIIRDLLSAARTRSALDGTKYGRP